MGFFPDAPIWTSRSIICFTNSKAAGSETVGSFIWTRSKNGMLAFSAKRGSFALTEHASFSNLEIAELAPPDGIAEVLIHLEKRGRC
jgi:hypothetical protein